MVNEIDSTELEGRFSTESTPLLLDIRSEAEVARGVLPNARHLPMHLLPLRMREIPVDTDVILYCRSGVRSYQACNYLMQQGYQNVINLRGGILAWARNGFEIVEPA